MRELLNYNYAHLVKSPEEFMLAINNNNENIRMNTEFWETNAVENIVNNINCVIDTDE